jgi:hypothetical protein
MESVNNMPTPNLDWRKSTRSIANGDCAEVATLPNGIAVRDTKDRDKLMLNYPADSWRSFVAHVTAGAFDTLR